MPALELIDQDHRKRYVAECKRAAGLGLTVDAYRTQHASAIADLTTTIRALMDDAGVMDPLEVLPGIIVAAEERCASAARKAAEAAARAEIKRLLRKATT
jgi:hypothetical protein